MKKTATTVIAHTPAANRDLTDRTRARRSLQESDSRFRILCEASRAGIYLLQEGLIKCANPSSAFSKGTIHATTSPHDHPIYGR